MNETSLGQGVGFALFRFFGAYSLCRFKSLQGVDFRFVRSYFPCSICIKSLQSIAVKRLSYLQNHSFERRSPFALRAVARSRRDLGLTGSRLNTALRRSYTNVYSTIKVTYRKEKFAALWLRGGAGIEFCWRMTG